MDMASNEHSSNFQQKVLEAFQRNLETVQIQWSYRIALLLVTIVMILLPVIYVSIICGLAYGLYYYYTNFGILFGVPDSGRALAFLLITPGIVVGSGIFFMAKPLFAKRLDNDDVIYLTQEEEPVLFAFVERLTQVVGAPMPKKIAISEDVNASAGFYKNWRGFFANELILTIGLPLAGGLTLNELAGVLAHEFGHFAQSAGMRLTYIVRSINIWFIRGVYERDSWDRYLDNCISEGFLVIAFVIAKGFVWFTRRILWCLMMIGDGVSNLMLRQMEYDADRYEASLVGPDTFESSARKINYLNAAFSFAQQDQQHYFQDGKLCRDMSALALFHYNAQEADLRKSLDEHLLNGKTSWDATHPSDRDRIANVRQIETEPVFDYDAPATQLFSDFHQLSSRLTQSNLANILGRDLKDDMFRDINELKKDKEFLSATINALESYFGDSVNAFCTPQVIAWDTHQSEAEVRETLKHLRKEWQSQQDNFKDLLAKVEQYTDLLTRQRQALCIRLVSASFDPDDYQVPSRHIDDINDAISKTQRLLSEAQNKLMNSYTTVNERLSIAMTLLKRDAYNNLPGLESYLHKLDIILETYQLFRENMALFFKIRMIHNELTALIEVHERANQGNFQKQWIAKATELVDAIREYMKHFAHRPMPIDHGDSSVSLSQYLLHALPRHEALGEEAYNLGGLFIENVFYMTHRLLGHIALLAQEFESGLELEPDPLQ